jgi:hypothetical protein
VAPNSQVGWGCTSSLFYKAETFGTHVLSARLESRQAFPSWVDQQNAAVAAL